MGEELGDADYPADGTDEHCCAEILDDFFPPVDLEHWAIGGGFPGPVVEEEEGEDG